MGLTKALGPDFVRKVESESSSTIMSVLGGTDRSKTKNFKTKCQNDYGLSD